jgi:nucleoside-triphosphatase THEP1
MGRALLLTGHARVGKTTSICRVIAETGRDRYTGFVANERRENGIRTGFVIDMLDGRSGYLASLDSTSDIRVRSMTPAGEVSYGVDLDFLENVAVPSLREAMSDDAGHILVVDEIGPMQLHSKIFQKLILDILGSDSLLFGSVVFRSFPWTDRFKELDGVETFELTPRNRDTFTEMMTLYLNSICPA